MVNVNQLHSVPYSSNMSIGVTDHYQRFCFRFQENSLTRGQSIFHFIKKDRGQSILIKVKLAIQKCNGHAHLRQSRQGYTWLGTYNMLLIGLYLKHIQHQVQTGGREDRHYTDSLIKYFLNQLLPPLQL